MPKDDIIVSFRDSMLLASDPELLKGSNWLNDRLISFYFEFLAAGKFPGLQRPDVGEKISDRIAFITPDVVQAVKICPARETFVFLEPLNLKFKDMVLCPINDADNPLEAGGTHWSLLVFDRAKKMALHFDSIPGCNSVWARHVFRRAEPFLGAPLGTFQFANAPCPRQENSYDCGVHVLINAEQCVRPILRSVLVGDGSSSAAGAAKTTTTTSSSSTAAMTDGGGGNDAVVMRPREMREEFLKVVRKMEQEYKKKRVKR